MYLVDIIPLTKIPHTQPQILSYFHGAKLNAGALVQIPLGRRQEEGMVIGTRDIDKMTVKNANFELRNISKIISAEPVLTKQQLELALFLGQYYFCSPGIFAKMMLLKSTNSKQLAENSQQPKKTKQTLTLVPTVSQAYSSYKSHPSDSILWHSELTQKQKTAARLAVKTGQARTVIGTRSAVFLPFANLKEIIIEDTPNPSHRSWDMFPHYDSRLVAQKLTEIFKAKLVSENGMPNTTPILSPSLKEGEIKRGWAPEANNRASPHIRDVRHQEIKPVIIDMREELKGGNFSIFSVDLYEAVKDALVKNQQIILFINRRGAANFILCRDCGYIAKCVNCDTPLAYHLINNKPSLLCHHCGAKDAPPGRCPKCHSWRIKTVGSGSQKIEAETKKFFPDAKILRLDSDSILKPKDQQKIIADFIDKQADVLIATPMLFSWLSELAAAKPTIVGILSADTLLHIPDFRSGERTWQTISSLRQLLYCHPEQSEGSRGSEATRATESLDSSATPQNDKTLLIQTYNPDNSVLKYVKNNDYAGFIKEDMETREALNYPPFSQIVKLTFRHQDAKRAGQEAKILAAKLNDIITRQINPEHSKNNAPRPAIAGLPPLKLRGGEGELSRTIEISPALPAFLPREKGKYAWNIIVKFLPFTTPHFVKGGLGGIYHPPYAKGGSGGYNSQEFLHLRNSLLQYVPSNWEIDVDPENLL